MPKKKTNDEFLLEIKTSYPNIIPVDCYINGKTKIKFKCKKCGIIWESMPCNILSGYGCPNCANKLRGEKLSKTNDKFINELHILHPNIIPLEEYKGDATKINVSCSICGHTWMSSPDNMLHRGRGCPSCSKKTYSQKRTKSHEQFISEMHKANPNIEAIGKYNGIKNKMKFKCNKCLLEWYTSPDSILNQKTGCPHCRESRGEKKINQWLIDNNIKFISQYTFADCKDIRVLPFDFYLPDYNVCIEYQGEQHYKPTLVFGGECEFEIRKSHDEIKANYCKANNINLILIPYYDYNNIHDILSKIKL